MTTPLWGHPSSLTIPAVAPPWRRLGVALVLAIMVLLAVVSPAAAHTDLDSTNPTDGSTLETTVEEVTLTFTLPVTQLGEGVSLRGPNGQIPAEVSSVQDGLVFRAVPEEPLTDGSYISEWTVAAGDGHPLSGQFAFTIDTGSAPTPSTDGEGSASATEDKAAAAPATNDTAGEDSGASTPTQADTSSDASGFARVMARLGGAVALWGALVAGGALIFAAGVLKGPDRDDTPVIATAIRWSAGLILIGLIVRVMSRAVLISQGDIAAAISPTAIGNSLGDTTRWVLGLQAGGALIVLIGTRPTLLYSWIPLIGILAVGSGHILAGHSNTIEPRWIILTADIAHLIAAAVWVGGVVMIGTLLRHRRRRGQPLNAAAIGARFSVIAAASATIVGLAGVVLAITILDRPQQLWQSTWGLFLLTKVAVVALVAAVGAYNHFRVVPSLAAPLRHEAPAGSTSEVLRRSATHETGIMLIIVLLTAWLVAAAVTP